MPWYVLYTKSRNEKVVAKKLRERDIDVYCPLIIKKRKWSDRIKFVKEPLFASYCFVNLEENQRGRVFGIPGIVRYLFWQNKPAVVRDHEIDAIKRMLNDFDHNLIQIETFTPAEHIIITSGFLANTEGKVIRQQGKQLTVLVDSLQVIIKVDLSKTSVSS